jgi:hypothetical protein
MNHAESNADDCSLQALDHPPIPRVGHQQRGRTAALCDLSALNAFSLGNTFDNEMEGGGAYLS